MNHPRIGIRPTIDGRWGGVRESLEEQTMNMAKSAAKLISENLRYPDGEPVEVVLSPTTIGGGAEAAVCEEFFAKENVIGTLTVTPCWCYGTETMDLNPNTIKAGWGFNGTERPGAVYLAAVMAAYAQRGLPALVYTSAQYSISSMMLKAFNRSWAPASSPWLARMTALRSFIASNAFFASSMVP